MDRRGFIKQGIRSAALLAAGTAMAQGEEQAGTPTAKEGMLPRRPYGDKGIELSVIGFGGIVVMKVDQTHADRVVAEAVERLGLDYVVLTSVNRDDLADGGAGVFADSLSALRALKPHIGVEFLTPDFHRCQDEAVARIASALAPRAISSHPGLVWGHNVETVPRLYRRARKLKGIKKVFIASGLRYDLAVRSPEYVKELVQHHVGGYLKIAPEHTEQGPLSKMMKPGIGTYDKFKEMFDKYSKQAGKEQYLIPYFISAHPGTTARD